MLNAKWNDVLMQDSFFMFPDTPRCARGRGGLSFFEKASHRARIPQLRHPYEVTHGGPQGSLGPTRRISGKEPSSSGTRDQGRGEQRSAPRGGRTRNCH